MKENAFRVREFFELSVDKSFPLVNDDYHGRTEVLNPPLGHAHRHRNGGLVRSKNALLIQRTPANHVAEDDLGPVWRFDFEEVHPECLVARRTRTQQLRTSGRARLRRRVLLDRVLVIIVDSKAFGRSQRLRRSGPVASKPGSSSCCSISTGEELTTSGATDRDSKAWRFFGV